MTFARLKQRFYGLILLVVMVGLVGLSVAAYQKRFTSTVEVTLTTDFTGNQLQPQSDVKVRGIEVGQVRSIKATPTGALVKLSLDPSQIHLIPTNVVAQLLPKTLFGEQYVALILPSVGVGTIAAGGNINQDHSYQAAQISDLLRNTQPILDALSPAELNATLTALATALRGRGDQIGQSLVDLDNYLKQLNPSVPQLATDIVNLGQVAATYDSALPDILATLDNLKTTSATISSRSAALKSFLTIGTSTSDTLSAFFKADGNQLIQVASSSVAVTNLLAEYAPEYQCVLSSVVTLQGRLTQAFSGNSVKVSVSTTKSQGAYLNSDKPVTASLPPACPNSSLAGTHASDGATVNGGTGSGALVVQDPSNGVYGVNSVSGAETVVAATNGGYSSNALGETEMVKTLISNSYGSDPTKVPDIAAIIAAPMLQGQHVEVSEK